MSSLEANSIMREVSCIQPKKTVIFQLFLLNLQNRILCPYIWTPIHMQTECGVCSLWQLLATVYDPHQHVLLQPSQGAGTIQSTVLLTAVQQYIDQVVSRLKSIIKKVTCQAAKLKITYLNINSFRHCNLVKYFFWLINILR